MKAIFCSFICLFLLNPIVWADNNLQQDCLLDLEALPEFILNNDAGGKDIFQEKGDLYFLKALQESKEKIPTIKTSRDCQHILHNYVLVWRKGHLGIEALEPEQNNMKASSSTTNSTPNKNSNSTLKKKPEIEFLSSKTLILRLPSFSPENRAPLIDLLDQHSEKIGRTINWIVDVRDNSGGSDSSYTPLLPWILENETQNIGASWLVTPNNIEAQRTLCAKYASVKPDCTNSVEKVIKRMEGQPVGSFVPQYGGPLIDYIAAKKQFHPDRVALVINQGCASSCEEFALKLRQSFNVKTIGTRTHGALDYSNLRPYLLPSGARKLWYATSRSNRLPDIKVDGNGIMADIYFPVPSDEKGKKLYMSRIQNWIEGGSLTPK